MTKNKDLIPKPIKNKDVPATAGMLYEMESRLNHRMDAQFADVRSEMTSIKSEMTSMKSELKSEMASIAHQLKSELHRVALLVEEQNARNKYVMDGYLQLYEFCTNSRK